MIERHKEIPGILAVLDPTFPLEKSIRYSGLEPLEIRGWRVLPQESIVDPSLHSARVLDIGGGSVKLCRHSILVELPTEGSKAVMDRILSVMGMWVQEGPLGTSNLFVLGVPKRQSLLTALGYVRSSGVSAELIFVQAVAST